MLKSVCGAFLFGVVFASMVSIVASWSCAGHMITTQIALQLLPSEVAQYFSSISAYQQMYYPELTSLTEVSCWPDDMKSYTNQYSPWHYYDSCLLRNSNGSNVTCPAAPEGFMPFALEQARQLLSGANNATLTMQEKAFWLAFLVHLVGDFHQPLHVTTLFDARFPHGDVGGNNFVIYVNNKKTNLHGFHDNCAGLLSYNFPSRPLAEYPEDLTTIETLSTSLIMSQTFKYPNQPLVTNTTIWQEEIFEIGKTISYSLPNGTWLRYNQSFAVDSEYVLKLQATLQNQLALGGRRLAAILQEIYRAVFPTFP